MPVKKRSIKSDLLKVDNHRVTKRELHEAPPLTSEQIASAVLKRGKPRGRPHILKPKMAVKLRLDQDVISHFKKKGDGWQTRINESLRKVAGLKA